MWNRVVKCKSADRPTRWMHGCALLGLMMGLFATATLQAAMAADDPGLDVRFDTLLRLEYSDARVPEAEDFLGSRTRLGLHYGKQKAFGLFGEIQYVLVTGLSENANAASALYRGDTASGMGDTNEALKLSQLWAEVKPLTTASLRLGRQPITMGGVTTYPEAEWNYLKKVMTPIQNPL